MVTPIKARLPKTAREFEVWEQLPGNANTDYEFISGEPVAMVDPTNLHQDIAEELYFLIRTFLRLNPYGKAYHERKFRIGEGIYKPDVAYITNGKCAESPDSHLVTCTPDIAVEIMSPSNKGPKWDEKFAGYMAAGVVVLLVYPKVRQVKICRQSDQTQPDEVVEFDGVVNCSDIIPDLTIPAREIFKDEFYGE